MKKMKEERKPDGPCSRWMGGSRVRARWLVDPRCFWCGMETTLTPRRERKLLGDIPYTDATVDHIKRGEVPYRTVLACRKCNEGRERDHRIAAAPSLNITPEGFATARSELPIRTFPCGRGASKAVQVGDFSVVAGPASGEPT